MTTVAEQNRTELRALVDRAICANIRDEHGNIPIPVDISEATDVLLTSLADWIDEQANERRFADGTGPYLLMDEARIAILYIAAVIRGGAT